MTGWKKHRQDELWTRQLFALLSCSQRLGHVWTGTGGTRGGGGIVGRTGGDRVERIICCHFKRKQGSWTSFFFFFKKCFPPEGQGAVGPSLSYEGMAFTNQPPSVFSSAAAWHVKQQLLRSLVYTGFTSVNSFLLFFLFVVLCSAHCSSASYVLVHLNTHTFVK